MEVSPFIDNPRVSQGILEKMLLDLDLQSGEKLIMALIRLFQISGPCNLDLPIMTMIYK